MKIVLLREDGLPRCRVVHPVHGQCSGIEGIDQHRHYAGPNKGLWQQQEWNK